MIWKPEKQTKIREAKIPGRETRTSWEMHLGHKEAVKCTVVVSLP